MPTKNTDEIKIVNRSKSEKEVNYYQSSDEVDKKKHKTVQLNNSQINSKFVKDPQILSPLIRQPLNIKIMEGDVK